MPKPTYDFKQSPNFRPATARKITAVVIHYTGSTSFEGTVSWFMNPQAKVSAHYLIGREGRCMQMVRDEDIAWHAGRSAMQPRATPPGEPNVNQFSIGIELVGTHDSGYTDTQMATLYALLEVLVSKYKIPPERVVGHAHISPGRKIDPDGYTKQFNWAKARNVAQVAYTAVSQAPHA